MNTSENPFQSSPGQNPQATSNPGTVPGIILLVIGVLGILINGYFAFSFYATAGNKDAMAQARIEMEKSFEKSKEGKSDEEKQQIDEMGNWILGSFESFLTNAMIVSVVFLVLALVTALGGFGLMKGSKGLGILGGLAAMVPQTCCLIGFPVGIWAIFAAMKAGKSTSPNVDAKM